MCVCIIKCQDCQVISHSVGAKWPCFDGKPEHWIDPYGEIFCIRDATSYGHVGLCSPQ